MLYSLNNYLMLLKGQLNIDVSIGLFSTMAGFCIGVICYMSVLIIRLMFLKYVKKKEIKEKEESDNNASI